MSIFFVSCQLGLEKDLQEEIENFWHLLIDLDGLPTRSRPEVIFEDQGGFEIECEMHLGLQINLFSKLANRVLLRIHKFECRYFDQFEKELKKFDFTKYLGKQKFNFYIESSKSRLFHEGNLLEAAEKALKIKIQNLENQPSVYVRIFKDVVTLSLDTSGSHLHKRGYRKQQGEAPLRETLAAKMFNFLWQESLIGHVDYNISESTTTLLDPFCGSGTLLFEAASFFTPNLVSTFDFEKFENIPALLKSPTWKKNFKISSLVKSNFLGLEIDPKTVVKAESNLQEFKSLFPELKPNIEFINQDSAGFDYDHQISAEKLIILTNPPYGERLNSNNALKIIQSFEKIKKLEALVVVYPLDWQFSFKELRCVKSIDFNNQGLKLRLSLFRKKEINS